jgi:hypothetical protein
MGELKREFKKHGFICSATQKQFFFPMGIHRALRSPLLSRALEGFASWIGLTALFGSPVIIRFERATRDNK